MSFQEKSIWVCLAITLTVFGSYFIFAFDAFSEAFSNQDAGESAFATIPIFIGSVIALSIIVAVVHVVLALVFSKEAEAGGDERDNLIELKATRISYFVLAIGVVATGLSLAFLLPLTETHVLLLPLGMANVIMFFFFLAEIVGWSLQLLYYRRGV